MFCHHPKYLECSNTQFIIALTRKWIEECTGCIRSNKTFQEYLQDGTLLCKLIETIRPGLVRKINFIKSSFAWRENLVFFLEACEELGLKGTQLFSPEDLQDIPCCFGRDKAERRLRNVAITIYWLGRKVEGLPGYNGPRLELELLVGDIEYSSKEPIVESIKAKVEKFGSLKNRSLGDKACVSDISALNKVTTSTSFTTNLEEHTLNNSTTSVVHPSAAAVTLQDINAEESFLLEPKTTEPLILDKAVVPATSDHHQAKDESSVNHFEAVEDKEIANSFLFSTLSASESEEDNEVVNISLRKESTEMNVQVADIITGSSASEFQAADSEEESNQLSNKSGDRLVNGMPLSDMVPYPKRHLESEALDMSRVRSDALPHSMHPKMLHYGSTGGQYPSDFVEGITIDCDSNADGSDGASLSDSSVSSGDFHVLETQRVVAGEQNVSRFSDNSKDHQSNRRNDSKSESHTSSSDLNRSRSIPLSSQSPDELRVRTSLIDEIWQEVDANPGSPSDAFVETQGEQKRESKVLDEEDVLISMESPQHHSTPARHSNASSTTNLAVKGPGIDSLLSSIRVLNEKVGTIDEEEEFKLLEKMLQSNNFKKAKELHDMMSELTVDDCSRTDPVLKRSVPIAHSIRAQLRHNVEPTDEVTELRELLRKPNFQALLFCHDKVSTKDFYVPEASFPRATQDPVDIIHSRSDCNFQQTYEMDRLAPLSRDVPSTRKENASIIFLERSNRPLGLTVYKQEDFVFVGKLLKGCDAEQSGFLREGDELLEVNGVPVFGRSTDEIVRLMSGEPGTALAFTLIPVHDDKVDVEYEPKYVRAHFNYDGRLDDEIPCRELGLNFQKSDIMEVSNEDDPNWWQARKVFEDGESLPGLIPSRHLMQKREALTRSFSMSWMLDERQKKKGIKSVFSKKRKKKVFYHQAGKSGFLSLGDEVVTYEDVMQLMPDPSRKRPIVLVGAPYIGKRTIIRRLLKQEPSHFGVCIQYTSRPKRPNEIDELDYYFVTRDEMERDIQHDRFLEHGELRGHLYGMSFSSIKKVMEAGKIPLLELHPQTLKRVRNSGLMPYIVFISSPRLERLLVTRRTGTEKQKKHHGSKSQVFTEADLQHLLDTSHIIENQYNHYFDWVIVNDNIDLSADMLREVARRLEEEPQWVPLNWKQD